MNEQELNTVYKAKKIKKDKSGKQNSGFQTTTFEQFCIWFKDSEFEKGCHYCQTTNERSFELYQMQRNGIRLDATRGGKRGRRLEIDRINPALSYDNLENLVWCCYWCNNTKSNFFTKEEFMPIAKIIGETLKKI